MMQSKFEISKFEISKIPVILFTVILVFGLLSCANSQKNNSVRYSEALSEYIVYDAIIVPGVPFYTEDGKWSDIMKARVYWAYHLYTKGVAKNVIFSGSAVYSPYIEAEIMALYGKELGIPSEHIFVETKAEHSTENVFYSKQLAIKHGLKSIALATDPFQTAMLGSFMKNYEPDMPKIPIVFSVLETIEMTDPDIDFKLAFVEDFVSITERQNLKDRLKGTQGKYIDYDESKEESISR